MDEFFKKIKNNEPSLKNFEVEVNPNEEADQAKDGSPLKKESQSDNLTFVESIPKPTNEDPKKEDVIRKPTRSGESDEEYKFSYFTETSIDDEVTKLKEEAVYEPNPLEKMLEEAGEKIDFLS